MVIDKAGPPRLRPTPPKRTPPVKDRHPPSTYLPGKKPFDLIEYASNKEVEYGKQARIFNNKGYSELALVFAGRCMALQEMLEAGGYPENVTKYGAL